MSQSSKPKLNLSPERLALLQILAEEQEIALPSTPKIARRTSDAALPLSFAQQRLWFLDQLAPGNPAYNIPIALCLRGHLNVAALEWSLEQVIQRHETLRTTFAPGDGQAIQVIAPRLPLRMTIVDLPAGLEQRAGEVQRLAQQEARGPFDLACGPLLRARLLRLADDEHVLLLTMHHIVSDAWSTGVLVREVTALYTARRQGRRAALPELPIQYADFAIWQREWLSGEVLEQQVRYWKQQLTHVSVSELPTDRPRPAVRTYREATQAFRLARPTAEALAALSQRAGVTLFMALVAAFQTLLARYTGKTDIVIGSPIANRTRVELEGLIGFFVNTLVLRTDLSGDPTFRELLQRVRDVTLAAYAYQDLPFERLVAELQPERDLSRNPLFQVMLVLQNAPIQPVELPELQLIPLQVSNRTAQFELTMILGEGEEGVAGVVEYNSDLFEATTIGRLIAHFQTLLEGVTAGADRRIAALPLLTAAERHQLIVEWNSTEAEQPNPACVHEQFATQARQTPDTIALTFEDAHLTYAELNRRTNQLAHHLCALGIRPEVRVGICMERSPEMVMAVYGVLKAGGVYVPLDPTYPRQRLAYMLADAQVAALLTQTHVLQDVPEHDAHVVCLDADGPTLAQQPTSDPPNLARPDHLAYVIYTSGSTGEPKGVQVAHRGLSNLVVAQAQAFDVRAGRRMLQFASLSFDASISELAVGLSTGSTICLAPQATLRSAPDLLRLLRAQAITTVTLPPSLLAVLPPYALPDLQTAIAAGEPSTSAIVEQWAPGRRFLNAYGPTEATVCATIGSCAVTDTVPTIGRPILNSQIYLLDAHMQPVPVGVAGELYIGGVQLARGYLGRPDLTAERFVPNPFADHRPPTTDQRPTTNEDKETRRQGDKEKDLSAIGYRLSADRLETQHSTLNTQNSRLYKTGDRARYLPDGSIDFLGRIDQQVKIRGFRIELGEIEALLTQHPAVREGVVLAREDLPGDKRLVAYIVPKVEDRGLKIEDSQTEAPETLSSILNPLSSELRAFLKDKLPEYMLPSAFIVLQALPLSPNGKVDRRALPAPHGARPELPAGHIPPRSQAERTIAAIWQDVLRVEQVGIHDNFFELGGHSVLVVQVYNRLTAAFGKEFPLTDMFRYTTVASLAEQFSAVQAPAAEPAPAEPRSAAPRGELAQSHDIAIIGMVGRFPGAADVDQFWTNLRDGAEGVAHFSDEQLLTAGVDPVLLKNPNYVRASSPLADIDRFDARFFGINPREAEVMDPQQRIFLEYAWQALEHAGYDPHRSAERIGVYAGQSVSAYLLVNLYPNQGHAGAPSVFQVLISNNTDYLATQVAYRLNLRGPALSVQTACSTSLVAVHLACQGLIDDACDIALAGGVSLRVPQVAGYLYEPGGILSADGHCRPFDAQAQGTVAGSGSGIVVLKRLDRALEDGDTIHAVIKGSAINNDGARKIGYTAPSEDGQVEVIRAALTAAGVSPAQISYVEAHGTGTALGDPIEVAALTRVFRAGAAAEARCSIGSVKSNIGHLDAAAGVAGLIKTVLALKHKQLPPSINYTAPNPAINFANSPFRVNAELRDWATDGQPRRAGVSSFGIGGTNAHVVVEEAPAAEPSSDSRPWQLLLLSAKTSTALEAATRQLADFLQGQPESKLADVGYTLQVGRSQFDHRRMLVCQDRQDGVAALESLDPRRVRTSVLDSGARQVVFMFPGQGAQYVDMARELYQTEPVFRSQVDRCAEALMPYLGCDLRLVLYPDPTDERRTTNDERRPGDQETRRPGDGQSETQHSTLNTQHSTLNTQHSSSFLDQTQYAQPALFVIEYALAQLWMSWGVRPQAMIGHSVGEYVAACLAGVFALDDALALVAQRGQLMQECPAGAMLAVPMAESAVVPLLGEQLWLAAVNSPTLCVVSGSADAIDTLNQQLQAQGIDARRLHVSHAFHSAMMDPVLDSFAEFVAITPLYPPAIPFLSNITGTWATAADVQDPTYWVQHIRRPVRFADGLRELLHEPGYLLLEVGPGETLSNFARQSASKREDLVVLASLRRPQSAQADLPVLLQALGRCWLAGVPVDWAGFYVNERRQRVALPPYPFDRERYWIDAKPLPNAAVARRRPLAEWFYVPSWKRVPLCLPAQPEQQAEGAWLIFADEAGLGERLADRLRQAAQTVRCVRPGPIFAGLDDRRYTINPACAEDYRALLAEMQRDGLTPTRVIHQWSLTSAEPALHDQAAWAETQERGFYSLLFLAQAYGDLAMDQPLALTVLSNQLYDLTGQDALCPQKATIVGACKVIPREYPRIACQHIDVLLPAPGTRQEAQLFEQVIAESDAGTPNASIAYRGPHRWVQIFEPVALEAGPHPSNRIRQHGVYLITGGLGGIGLTLADYLAKTAQAKLILVGRASPPPRAAWSSWAATHGEDDPTSTKIRKLLALEACGAEVLALSADVADLEQMRAVLEQGRQHFGALHGVIHAAGVAGGGLIQLKTREAAEEILAPKVRGTLVLDALCQDLDLDFLVLCSSLSSIVGELGQIDYCAANAFLDAYAQYQARQSTIRTVAINWDSWRDVGMAVNTSIPGAFQAIRAMILDEAILPEEGAEVFARALGQHAQPQVVVATKDLQTTIEQSRTATQALFGDAAPSLAVGTAHARPSLQSSYVAPRNQLEQEVAAIWQQLLGISEVGVYDNFFELGGHSLLATQIASRIRNQFGVQLSIRRLLEAPTVADLALAVAEDQLGAATDQDAQSVEALLAEVEGLSDADLQRLLAE